MTTESDSNRIAALEAELASLRAELTALHPGAATSAHRPRDLASKPAGRGRRCRGRRRGRFWAPGCRR